MGIVLAILLFGFIVFHELGHFLLARINGINVYEFWIGMGPTLAHKKIGNTDYCLKILPIGGACVMGKMRKRICQRKLQQQIAVAQDLGHCRRSGI